ncbi:MAG TPA: PEP-CTERM sorting domain-containing protein [Bryobacteraceae bacterium]|nr:PEP-CTERM sorting domain-containing protein [Bryobacteraceae bacterium]
MTGILVHPKEGSGRVAIGIVLPLLSLIFVVPARSTTYEFITAPGATTSNGSTSYPVDIEAILNVNTVSQTIVIQLLNLESNPTDALQELGSIQISFSGLNSSTTAPSVTASSFTAVNITSNLSQPTVVTPTPATAWHSAQTPSSTATEIFCANCPTGGNKQLLIGGPSTFLGFPLPYLNADSSITASADQPEVIASGQTYTSGNLAGVNTSPQWTLFVPELGSNTRITAVTFGFGTNWGASGSTVAGQLVAIPEPGSASLILMGGCMIGASLIFRKKLHAAAPASPAHPTAIRVRWRPIARGGRRFGVTDHLQNCGHVPVADRIK